LTTINRSSNQSAPPNSVKNQVNENKYDLIKNLRPGLHSWKIKAKVNHRSKDNVWTSWNGSGTICNIELEDASGRISAVLFDD